MNWLIWWMHLAVSTVIFLCLTVMVRSVSYAGKHPVLRRRIGAWLLSFSSCGFAVANFAWLAQGMDFACPKYHLASLIMLVLMLTAALLLFSRNPARNIDGNDYDTIMKHFETATCEFATHIRAEKAKRRELE